MKKFVKNAVLLLLTGSLFFGTVNLGACTKVPDKPVVDDHEHEKEDPTKPPVDLPGDKEDPTKPSDTEDNKKALEEAVAKLDVFLNKAEESKNFHYSATSNGSKVDYYFNGNDLKLADAESVVYFQMKDNDSWKIYQENEVWKGDLAGENLTVADAMELCLSRLDDAEWTSLEGSQLVGKENGSTVTLNFDGNAIAWQVKGDEFYIGEINHVTFEIPKYEDLTKPAEEYVYETVNGQRQYNIPVLAKALEETLKANPDILKKANGGIKLDLIKVTHIKIDEKGLGFGTYCSGLNNSKSYNFLTLNEAYTSDKMNVTDFKKYLLQTSLTMHEGANCETSTEEHDEEFNIMAQNVLEKLAQDGCQGESINNKADGISEFAKAKVLFGYKTKNSSSSYGGDLGLQSASEYMMIVEKPNGGIEELNLKVSVANSQYEQNYYLSNLDTNKVLIVEFEREEIDKENAKLYENESNIRMNMNVTPFFEEKRR